MKLQFLGATGTVTGSKYLLKVGGFNVLVDCGLFQGLKALRLRNWAALPIEARRINAVILTHAHLDHSAYLPLLVKQGFRGKVYCTPGTRDLCGILLPDSGYLQEEEARYANKRGFSRHKPALPLYTEEDAKRSLSSLHAVPFHSALKIGDNIEVSFIPAGHILGAAIVKIQAEGRSVVWSGDLGRSSDPIMKPPEVVKTADYLLVESTYGDRRHETKDPALAIAEVINRTVKRGGMIVVPAFAVGRAQTLLYYIALLKKEKRIPDIPVFLNSPMAIEASELYREYRSEHRLSPDECYATCHIAHYVRTVEESKRLNALTEPTLIISASGMATGGRVLHHLKAYAPDPRNTILLTGYQAAGTRGQAIANGAEAVKIHGEYVPIHAEVALIHNLSAHADYGEILDWLSHFSQAPKTTFITHGETAAADALRRRIEEARHWNCLVPEYLSEIDLV